LAPGSQPRRPFGPLTGEIRVYWLNYVTAENVTNFDPNKNRFLSSYTQLSANNTRGDGLNLEYTWIDGVQEQINARLRVRLHSSVDAIYGKRYSWQDKQSLETFYGVQYRHQCWTVDASFTERPAIAGQPAERKFLFMVNLTGITSVGSR
jgi:LPS-assembly protein